MVPLVADHLGERLHVFACFAVCRNRCQAFPSGCNRFVYRGGVAEIRPLKRNRSHGACVHIHRMLCLVSEVSATVSHLRNARIRVVRARPVLIRAFALAVLVDLAAVLTGRGVDT